MKLSETAKVSFCWFILSLGSCSDSNDFAGSGATKQPQTPQTSNATAPAATAATTPTANNTAVPTATNSATTPIPNSTSNAPNTATTAGSFKIWASPTNPQPGQDYTINIEVSLPSNISNYQRSDLTGLISGTDGYRHTLDINQASLPIYDNAEDKKWGYFESFSTSPGRAHLIIPIPGAENLIRDEITVYSQILNERQVIQLTFSK